MPLCHRENIITGVLDETLRRRTKRSTSISSWRTGPQGGSRRVPRVHGDILPLDVLRVFDKHEPELLIGRNDGDRHGRLDAVHRLPRVREDEPGDRVVLGVPPLVVCGARGVPAPIHDGHIARAHRRIQGYPGQRRPAPLYDREERGPERPPTQPHVLQSPQPTAVR